MKAFQHSGGRAQLSTNPTRRQAIVGVMGAVGGLTLRPTGAWAAAEDGISHTADSIHQEPGFGASPKRVYEALTDAKQFTRVIQLSGALEVMHLPDKPAEISREVGGAFVLYGGHITGRHIELVPNVRMSIDKFMLGVAPRIIWFEPPERALANPVRFMAYAMRYARHEDMRVIREYVSDEDFREALDRAPPGIIDSRSWAYWNSKMGRYPPPPLPKRHFGNDQASATLTGGSGRSPYANTLSHNDLQETQRAGCEAWLKMRQLQPKENLEEVRRRAREDWLAKRGPERK